jgi:protein O-GlcNAc transferase
MSADILARLPTTDPVETGRVALMAGDPDQAVDCFQRAARMRPLDPDSRYWLYSAGVAAGQYDVATQALAEARDLHAVAAIRAAGADMARFQSDPAYRGEVGTALYAGKLMGPASLALGRSLDFDRLDGRLMISYGLSLQHQGRTEDAVNVFNVAADSFDNASVHEFLIYALFHAQDGVARVAQEARRWAERHAAPHQSAEPVFSNERTAGRRLRIGYMGPNFSRSQVAQFLLPVLDSHDPEAVEVFLYCPDPDAESGLPKAMTLRAIADLDDEAVAVRIRDDRIDILVEVWGHAAGNRLTVFAHRPAPVQIAWINFVQTTGLDCMDYVLHADSMDAPGTSDYFVEQIWRMGEIMVPYRPAPDRPDPVPTPALGKGHVTFGSFNNPAKISEPTVFAWAQILRARPADRLVFKYSYYVDPVLQRVTQARFAAYGVEPERLEFRGHSVGVEYLRAFADIDLALDPSPCPGGTTTCDALANGVPVLTLKGANFFSRIGLPALLPCGLTELIAEDWDDYIARALDLTADLEALNALRARVRPAFEASAYRDEQGFTRRLELDFRRMYGLWLERTAAKAEA